MTHRDVSASGRAPGRRWYVVAAIVALAGWLAMALFLVARLSDSTGRMMRVLAPGQTDLILKEAGTYTIHHEFASTFEGRVYNVSSVSGLEIKIRARPGGAEIPLQGALQSRYSVGATAGRSLFDFEIPAPGTYQISATYSDGRSQPQTVLAIDRGFVGELVLTILGALAMAFAGTGIAVAIAVVVASRRRRARVAARA
jgi:hypothetical protein